MEDWFAVLKKEGKRTTDRLVRKLRTPSSHPKRIPLLPFWEDSKNLLLLLSLLAQKLALSLVSSNVEFTTDIRACELSMVSFQASLDTTHVNPEK